MDILTDDEIALSQDDPRYKPKSKRGVAGDIGLGFVSGVAMGTVEVATAPDALIRGDKKAAALRAQNLTIFKPEDLGTEGELTYGLTKDFTRVGWNVLGTLGTGGYISLASQAGLFGAQSYQSEKSDLLNKGADIGTARTGAIVKGATDTAGYAIPVHGIAKNPIADAIATTGLALAGGAVGDYVEGDLLKDNKNKKVAEYGAQLQENATSPLALGANGTIAFILNAAANKAKLRPEQADAHQMADDLTHAGQVMANMDHADGLNPFTPETARDNNSHYYALDSSLEQALNAERVSLDLPVTGSPKQVTPPKTVIKPLVFKGKAASTQQQIYDTAVSKGLSISDAKATLAIAHFESRGSFDPNVTNAISGFKGIGQFKPSTWRAEGGTDANYTDLSKQIEILVKHTQNNIAYIKEKTGVTLTGSQIYLPHLLGRAGAKAVMKAIRDTPEAKAGVVLRKIYGKDTKAVINGNGINPDESIQVALGRFTSKIDDLIVKQYGGDIQSSAIRGSESDFPEFESDIAVVPEYKRDSDVLIESAPNSFIVRNEENSGFDLEIERNFKHLEEPINADDIDYLKATAHYQPYDGNVNRVEYVEPQIDLSGQGQSAQRNLNVLETQLQNPVLTDASNDAAPTKTVVVESAGQQSTQVDNVRTGKLDSQEQVSADPLDGVDNWQATRSENYLKREMSQADGSSVQELYNKSTNTLFQRQVNSDGTITPVKATRSGQEIFANPHPDAAVNESLNSVQSAAAQALEREFWKPKNDLVDGAPDLSRGGQGEYGSFATTADGREAVTTMTNNPYMEITVTRFNENGDEEVVVMSARDWLDYVREQEEVAKDDIQAVKALASCALKYGSEAA